jgi:exonuclease III
MTGKIQIFSFICLKCREILFILRKIKLVSINVISKNLALHSNSSPINVRLMTYNIRHGLNMKNEIDLHGVAHVINKFSPDLVALQEIDDKTNRCHGVDELQELANLTQMNYYFASAMSRDGGHYGVGILCKWPIDHSMRYPLPQYSNVSEPRTVGVITTKVSGENSILKYYFSIEISFKIEFAIDIYL